MRQIRFEPDPLDYALIDFNPEPGDFNPDAVALIINESHYGCALVIKTTRTLNADEKIRIKVGRLHPMIARIVWGTRIESEIFKVGIELLE